MNEGDRVTQGKVARKALREHDSLLLDSSLAAEAAPASTRIASCIVGHDRGRSEDFRAGEEFLYVGYASLPATSETDHLLPQQFLLDAAAF